ncbi:SGNH/GDSL hydrolase family protein [Streptomyces triticiradicis]|uniref:SGNH/GDSL hydrolase family protein n=1 Tax=Streptomyces triticiradicis TaxID=2651189 RepID=A0A7J5DHQ5_9ACTN|nr:SGNH/GDSL hydrolase family protein [Streptomyces triticiradicis]KAB1988196.1 SGNH/GDSL hydrolase family protein [Streptomyces triticiradicis]
MTDTANRPTEADDPYLLSAGETARVLADAPWKRLAVVGDSGAEGVTEAFEGYRCLPWSERFVEELRTVQPDLAFVNLGLRNLFAAQVRETQLAPALEFRPDLAVVFSGGNDMLQRHFDIDAVESELERVVAPLRETGCTVLTSGLFDITVSPYVDERYRKPMSERIAAWSERTKQVAARLGAVHVDLPRHPAGTEEIYSTDGLHLNARGQAILCTEIVRSLAGHLQAR